MHDAQALHRSGSCPRALAERTRRARDGQLGPGELTGGTFTLNNYGVFGVDGSAAIINHPEVAILGIGRIIERPWVVDGQLVVRQITQLTLAFDHRVCDGGTAGGFLRFVADCVESPAQRHAEHVGRASAAGLAVMLPGAPQLIEDQHRLGGQHLGHVLERVQDQFPQRRRVAGPHQQHDVAVPRDQRRVLDLGHASSLVRSCFQAGWEIFRCT